MLEHTHLIQYGYESPLCLVANLIDGYCGFVNDTDQSYLHKKQQLGSRPALGAQNGGAMIGAKVQGKTSTAGPTGDTPDGAATGRQKKFRVSCILFAIGCNISMYVLKDVS